MKINVLPKFRDINSEFRFQAAPLELFRDNRLEVVNKFCQAYDLSFNDINFDNTDIAKNHINFIKHHDNLSFRIALGLEAIVVKLRHFLNADEMRLILRLLSEVLDNRIIADAEIYLYEHLELSDNNIAFLDLLSPTTPEQLSQFIISKGSSYDLLFQEEGLSVTTSISRSEIIDNGLFFHLAYRFDTREWEILQILETAISKYDFIINSLNLFYPEEGKDDSR